MGRLKIKTPGPQFRTTLTVRVDDINYREHLAHDKVLTLCHEARRQFFESKKLIPKENDVLYFRVTNLLQSLQGDIVRYSVAPLQFCVDLAVFRIAFASA